MGRPFALLRDDGPDVAYFSFENMREFRDDAGTGILDTDFIAAGPVYPPVTIQLRVREYQNGAINYNTGVCTITEKTTFEVRDSSCVS